MDTTSHEARIHEMDRALAPGSETVLLGHALDEIRRSDDPTESLAWWVGAYRMLGWQMDNPDKWERVGQSVWDDAAEMILESGEYLVGWTPPAPTPDDLRRWRDAEGLTQERAAVLAGVQRVAWARWEIGKRSVPQWLGDVLQMRWESAP